MSVPKVRNIKIEKIQVNDSVLKKYGQDLKRSFIPERVTFDIENVNVSVANALRRTVVSEVQSKAMYFDDSSYSCSDALVPGIEMIRNRFSLIPLDQSVSLDAKFSIDVTNNEKKDIDVRTTHIKTGLGKQPFNNFIICRLRPGCRLKITDIVIKPGYGYMHAMYSQAFNATCLPLDQNPDKVSASMCNPRAFRIAFNTNGNIPATSLMIAVCDSIIQRAQTVSELATSSLAVESDSYSLTVHGETDTIGKLFERIIYDSNPHIGFIAANVASIDRIVTFHIRSDDDVKQMFISAANNTKYIMDEIKKAFSLK